MAQNIDIESFDSELRDSLLRIGRLTVAVRCLTAVVYSAVLCWFVYCFYTSFWGWRGESMQSESAWIYIASAFILFLVLNFLLMYCLTTLQERKTQIMRKAVHSRFPDAVYSPKGTIPRTILQKSLLFDLFPTDNATVDFTGYGKVTFSDESGTTEIYDIGVTSGRISGLLGRLPGIGSLVLLYRYIVRPIFGAPIESTMHSFRGMFGTHTYSTGCKGSVILLPDRLESNIGYLAHSIQAFRHRNGASHIILEDVDFERFFAVYADNEIEARKILTPATMQRITNLRHAFGRELFISFSEDKVYYAVQFSGGFLRPSRKSLKDAKLFEQIFYELSLGRRCFGSRL